MNTIIALGRVSTLTKNSSFTGPNDQAFVDGTCYSATLGVAGGRVLACKHDGTFNKAADGEELCFVGELPVGEQICQ